jgi:hypothetical protein
MTVGSGWVGIAKRSHSSFALKTFCVQVIFLPLPVMPMMTIYWGLMAEGY